MTEVLLSLRVNALQIPPEQRKNFVAQLIKVDFFKIQSEKSLDFIQHLLAIQSHSLKHAMSALLSILVSTPQGVEYISHANGQMDLSVIERIIELLKLSEDGSVTQRFQIALL